jgi:hypothetical protein
MGTEQIKQNALQLLARFSLPPNSLGYCGKGSATEKFKNCIIHGNMSDLDIESEIEHFIVLHPYIKTISQIVEKSKFDYEVAECFWLGNNLLNNVKNEHYDLLLDNFLEQGVPVDFVDELRSKRPKQFIPFHLFQVLHVGVGKSSGAVPFNLNSINNCMIRWGIVSEIVNNKLTANFNSLKMNNGTYVLTQIIESFEFNPLIVRNLKVGDTVSVHWGVINKILTKEEVENLEFWSKKTLQTLVY